MSKSQPPQPPPTKPKLKFYTLQLIGMGAFSLIALLALAGVFGNSSTTAEARTGNVSVEAKFPTRLRFKTISTIDIRVRNDGGEAVPVTVRFPSEYLKSFSNVRISPEPRVVSLHSHEVDLGTLAPGHTRLLAVELQAEEYGSASGRIEVLAGDGTAAIDIKTFNLP